MKKHHYCFDSNVCKAQGTHCSIFGHPRAIQASSTCFRMIYVAPKNYDLPQMTFLTLLAKLRSPKSSWNLNGPQRYITDSPLQPPCFVDHLQVKYVNIDGSRPYTMDRCELICSDIFSKVDQDPKPIWDTVVILNYYIFAANLELCNDTCIFLCQKYRVLTK